MANLRPLRPHQAELVEKIQHAAMQGYQSIMVQAPCGFGKTLTAAHLINNVIENGGRACFVAPRLTLIDQTVDSFIDEGFNNEIGVIQGQHPRTNWRKPLQVASLQTLTRRHNLSRFDLLIVDEAHMTSTAFLKLKKGHFKDSLVIGLSATPWREGLGQHYDTLIVGGTTQGLIDMGYLVQGRVLAPAPEIDLSGVKTTAGDYNQRQLADKVNTREIVGDIIKHWQQYGENRPTICFCVDRAHAKHVQQRFEEAGIPAGYVDCFTMDMDRKEIVKDFRNGDIRVLCNVGVMTTGFDAPEASCMIDAAPTKSLTLHVQKTGRVLRTAPGKKDAIILDHAGNTLKLGLVEGITRDTMCNGDENSKAKRKEQEKKDPKPRLCEECKVVMAPHHESCPECGTLVKKFTQVIHRDGELHWIGGPIKDYSDEKLAKKQRQEFMAGLRFYGRQKGYKDSWADWKFKERYGKWPNALGCSFVNPAPPTLETLNYIKAGQIAYAKARQKAANRGEDDRFARFMREGGQY